MKNKFIKLSIVFLLLAGLLILYQWNRTDPIISLGVSTDGRYVISAHAPKDAHPFLPKGELVLWDISKKEKTILARNVNAYSAVFIPNTHEFMWQDHKNIIHIQNVNGEEINSFQHFPIKGHLMSEDKSFYLSANEWNQLYEGFEKNLQPIYTDGGGASPITLSVNKDYFLSSSNSGLSPNKLIAETKLSINPINPDSSKRGSYDGVTLWDRHTLKPVARLWGHSGKTTGLISPDGNWVVTGGENFGNYMWSMDNLNQRLKLEQIDDSVIYRKQPELDKKHPIPVPEKYSDKQITLNDTVAISFLSEKDFVLFNKTNTDELVPVYTVGDPLIKGYVETGKPYTSTNYFQRNLSVSSSPSAHILVTGQATGGGINVYKYHPDKMELEKIWVAD